MTDREPQDSQEPDVVPAEELGMEREHLDHLRALALEEETPEIEQRRTHWVRYVVLLSMLGLGIYLLLPQVGSLRESVRVMRGLKPWAVGLAVLAQVLSTVALGFMMRRIVELTGQHLRLRRAVAVTLASGSVGLVAGGLIGIGGSSYRWLRDGGIRAEGAVLAGWLPALLHGGVMAVTALLGIAQLMVLRSLSTAQWVGSIFSLLVIGWAVGITWWGSHHHAAAERMAVRVQARWARLRRKPARPQEIASTVEGLFDAMDLLKRRGWKGPLAAAAGGVGLDALSLFFVLLAAGHAVTPGVLLAGYGIPRLIGKVGVIPGGLGLVEAMMVAIFTSTGVPTAHAVSVVLGYRVLSFWMPNLSGFLIMPALQATARIRVPRPLPTGRAARDPGLAPGQD